MEPTAPEFVDANAVKIKKIHYTLRCRTTARINTSTGNPDSAERSGDVVAACTRWTGPIVDIYNQDPAAISGFLKPTTANTAPFLSQMECYSTSQVMKMYHRGFRNVTLRKDVAYGMKPIKFSFTPTIAAIAQSLDGTLDATELIAGSGTTLGDKKRLCYKYPKWYPVRRVTSSTNAIAPSSTGVVPQEYATAFGDAMNFPYFGVYTGLVPGSIWYEEAADKTYSFPQLEYLVQADVCVKKSRRDMNAFWQANGSANSGVANNQAYADFGNIPTMTTNYGSNV